MLIGLVGISVVLLLASGLVLGLWMYLRPLRHADLTGEAHARHQADPARVADRRVHVSIITCEGRRVVRAVADEFGTSVHHPLTGEGMSRLRATIRGFAVEPDQTGSTPVFQAEPDVAYRAVAMVLRSILESGHSHIAVRCEGASLSLHLPHGPPELNRGPPHEPLVIVLRSDEAAQVRIWLARSPPIPNGDFQKLRQILKGWRYHPQRNPNGYYDETVPVIIRPDLEVHWRDVFTCHRHVVEAEYPNIVYAMAHDEPGPTRGDPLAR